MSEVPDGKCGYIWPEDHEPGDNPGHQSCCYRDTVGAVSRCAWHVAPENTDKKTVEMLTEPLVSPGLCGQTRPVDELLNGAKLAGVEIEDSLSLNQVSLRDADLTGANLHRADLTGADLRYADLTDADLREADLSGADLREADLTDANLGRAVLTGAMLYKTTLAGAYLGRADLAGANLESADLRGANLGRADLTEVILGRANLEKATLQGATLTDASLGRANVSNANFYMADLTETYFGRADMTRGTFENADLTGSNLGHANLVNVNFRNATLTGANLGRADLTDANLGHADLSGATLQNATLADAVLEHADLTGATLRRLDLTGANLESAGLSEVDLGCTDATGACFVGVDLTGANLHRMTLTGTDLRDCNFSGSDLREAVIQDLTVNQGTRCGKQTRAEQAADDAPTWDAIARAYNDLKRTFSAVGLVGKARQYHVLERRARGFEAGKNGRIGGYIQFDGSWLPSLSSDAGNFRSYGMYVSSLASRVTTGFGVRPLRLVLWMLFLFGFAAVLYELDPGIGDSVYHSVVTFTTAPPAGSEPTMAVVRAVELIETFGGTLLIVLLGYVLGNRERF